MFIISKFRILTRSVGVTLITFFVAFGCKASTMTLTFPPQLQRAIWIGDSNAITSLDKSQPLVAKFLASEAGGYFDGLKAYNKCDFVKKQAGPTRTLICRMLLAGLYFSQGDIPALANDELLGSGSLRKFEIASGRSNLQVPQFEVLSSPVTAIGLPSPQFHVHNQVSIIHWDINCPLKHEVAINIDNHNVCFKVDLGNNRSLISAQSAKKASLNFLKSREISGQFRNGHFLSVPIAYAANLKIGRITAKNIYFAVEASSSVSSAYNSLGLDFLMHLGSIKFEKDGIVINAHSDSHRSCAPIAYGLTSGFTLRGILLPVDINDVGVYLMIDSGSSLGLLLYDGGIVADLNPVGTIRGFANGINVPREGWAYMVSTDFLGISRLKTYAGLSLWGDPAHFKGPIVGSIGLPLLQQVNFLVDFARHKVCTSIQK